MASASSPRTRRLGVFGTSGSGKTVFLTTLAHTLWQGLYNSKYDYPKSSSPVSSSSGKEKPRGSERTWQAILSDELMDFVIENYTRMEEQKIWPKATGGKEFKQLGFELRNKPLDITFDIRFYEYFGEWLDRVADETDDLDEEGSAEFEGSVRKLQEHFDLCDGYIFLVDGEDLLKNSLREQRVYQRLLKRLKRLYGNRIEKPCVFAFTKKDLAPNEYEDPERFSEKHFGSTHTMARELFTNIEFTGISSVGASVPVPGDTPRPSLDRDHINCDEPFFKVIRRLTDEAVNERDRVRRKTRLRRLGIGIGATVIVIAGLLIGSSLYKDIKLGRQESAVAALCREAGESRASGRWKRALELLASADGIVPDHPKAIEIRQKGPIREITNSLGMIYVLVEREDANHNWVLDGYYMGKHEVSWSQYNTFLEAIFRERPALKFLEKYSAGDDGPAIGISWQDGRDFCVWLTNRERRAGRLGKSEVFRLPLEEEWEFAAAGPGASAYPWGNHSPNPGLCNLMGLKDGYEYCAPVGSYARGESLFGCLDMSGNVWEWCLDPYYRTGRGDNDLRLDKPDEDRCLRGGAWNSSPEVATTVFRKRCPSSTRSEVIGFRVVRGVPLPSHQSP